MKPVSSLRRSPLSTIWSVVAPGRSSRPHARTGTGATAAGDCPFCEGNERETAPEVFAVRAPDSPVDGPGWTVRVVPNKFPALRPRAAAPGTAPMPFDETAPAGYHEVIIDAPEHDAALSSLPIERLETALRVYRSRVEVLSRRPGVRSVLLFRNDGREAGASQLHPHSQILAMPLVAGRLLGEVEAAERHFEARGRCLTCEILERELERGERVIAGNGHFVAIASFAPRFPYETWIVPAAHAPEFGASDLCLMRPLADILQQVLQAMENVLGRFAFNLALQTAPVGDGAPDRRVFHWRLEILPRLTAPSGLELGSDVFIVSAAPEDVAAALRAALECSSRLGRQVEARAGDDRLRFPGQADEPIRQCLSGTAHVDTTETGVRNAG